MSNKPIINSFALLISIVFSPFIIIPFSIAYLSAFFQGINTKSSLLILMGSLLIIGLPGLYIIRKVRAGKMSDYHISLKKERFVPMVIGTSGALIFLAFLIILNAPKSLINSNLLLVIDGTILLFITKRYKISLHTATLTAIITIFTFYISPMWAFAFLAVPLVAWCRMYRGRHTLSQVLAGVFVALAVNLPLLIIILIT